MFTRVFPTGPSPLLVIPDGIVNLTLIRHYGNLLPFRQGKTRRKEAAGQGQAPPRAAMSTLGSF